MDFGYASNMARRLRIEFSGPLYHVTSRGDRREAIFEDVEDRLKFLNVLAEMVERFNWLCHAYCLMSYREIARHFGLRLATVGRIVRRRMLQSEN